MSVFIPGTDCIVSIDNASNSLTNISDDVSTIALDVAYQSSQFFTLGLSGAQTEEGPRAFTGSFGLRPAETDDTSNGHYLMTEWLVPGSGVKAGQRSVRIQHPDAAVGSYQYDYEIAPATNYNLVNADAGGDGTPNVQNLAYNVDGDVTLTVIT